MYFTPFFNRLRTIIILLGICFVSASATIHIKGRVIDETGASVSGVRLTLGGSLSSTTTDDQGKFNLTAQNTSTRSNPLNVTKNLSISISRGTLILSGQGLSKANIELTGIDGRMIYKEMATANQSKALIPTTHIAHGAYILSVISQNYKLTGKLVFNGDKTAVSLLSTSSNIDGKNILAKQAGLVSGDSLFCVKLGYFPVNTTIGEIDTQLTITLNMKKWISVDFHNHTWLSDGSKIEDSVLAHAFSSYNLDLFVNSEHGGSFRLDTNGNNYMPDSSSVWRWRCLVDQSWPKILHQRSLYPSKVILQGLEWNVPTHEHASVGFINDAHQPAAISDFEYMFDQNDLDSSKAATLTKKNKTHADAIAATAWLQANYPNTSYYIVNHPSRKLKNKIQHFRDFNNAGPNVAFGFEGIPGHQKEPSRGGYGNFAAADSVARASTYGGADYMVARVGGLWDAMLCEGRKFYSFVTADFHSDEADADFWPGEYSKTWVAVKSLSGIEWLAGMRSGEAFAVHGDLINGLDFMIDDNVKAACMGQSLTTNRDSVTIFIRYKSPVTNNNGEIPVLHHVDLISGEITGFIDPASPSYSVDTNASVVVVKTFVLSDFSVDGEWKKVSYGVKFSDQNRFFRLRGTNLGSSVTGETDSNGNPLMDERNTNTASKAWSDLWFYSNPVFIYKK